MKNPIKIIILALAAVMLAACSLAPPAGRITLEIPARYLTARSLDAGMSRALDAAAPTHVRIWLESRGQLQSLAADTLYEEYEIPDNNTVTVEGISPAKNCILYVSLGTVIGDSFIPLRYADSSSFQVLAGATSYVFLTVKDSPFVSKASAEDADGVKALYHGGKYYALASDKLILPSGADSLAVAGANGLTVGKAMNADGTFGAARIWINTSAGIVPFDPDSGTLEAAIEFTKDKNIVNSGTLTVPFDGVNYQVAYYQRPGSIGFAKLDKTTNAWVWKDLLGILAENPSMSSFADLISGSTSKLLADMDIHYDGTGAVLFGYTVVPVLNTFRFDSSLGNLFGGTVPDPITLSWITDNFLGEKNLVSVPAVGTVQPLIKTISQSGAYLYIGTDQGVFIAGTDTAGVITATPALVSLPRKTEIVQIRASSRAAGVWAAALARDGTVFLFKNGDFKEEYRFHSGAPKANGNAESTGEIFWTDHGLTIAGVNGVVLLPNAKLPE